MTVEAASSKEQVLLVLYLRALELGRIDHARKHDVRGAWYVVAIDTILVAVALEQVHGVRAVQSSKWIQHSETPPAKPFKPLHPGPPILVPT